MQPPYAMRDVSSKFSSLRTAKATATLVVAPATIKAIRTGAVPKADPLAVAKIAGIQAAKQTSLLIPYCHQIPLDFVALDIRLSKKSIDISSEVRAIWKTGVEMEALVAVSAAALALYDMLKPIDENMELRSVSLVEKRGGKSELRIDGKGLRAAVVVMSDSLSRKGKGDLSGKILVDKLKSFRFSVSSYNVMPDEREEIERKLIRLADRDKVDLIVTTGGTGMSPRDVTPEATLAVIDRRLEGVEEAMRSFGQDRTPMAMLSRAVAGVRNSSLIINFPGSPRAVEEGWNALFPAIIHVFRMMKAEGH